MVTAVDERKMQTTQIKGGDGRLLYRVKGLTPLIMHNPEGNMGGADDGVGKKRIPTPDEEARRGLYKDVDGRLWFKGIAFRNSILNATEGRKIGKTAAKRIVASALFPTDEWVYLIDPETGRQLMDEKDTDWRIDTQRAVVQRQGILRSRPRLDRWACNVEFTYDRDDLTEKIVTALFQRAGKIQGVGDQRPGAPRTPGGYGKYQVELVAAE